MARDSSARLAHTFHLTRVCPVTPWGTLKGKDVLSRSSRETNATLAAGKAPEPSRGPSGKAEEELTKSGGQVCPQQ